jgi:mono/diheme cytochrome c family protein
MLRIDRTAERTRNTRKKRNTRKSWEHAERSGNSSGRFRVFRFFRVFRVLFCLTIFALLCASCRQDMQDQPKYKPLAPSSFFSDGKSARQLVEGTAPYSPEGKAAPPMADLSKMTTPPFALTPQVMDRGQERFNINCSPCHGRLGYGNGMVVQRGFLAPPSYHIDRLRQAPIGHFYDVMTNGFGAMSSYADKVAPNDRWAIAAYIRALQLSQHATIDDAPPEERAKLQSGGQKQ